MLKKLSIYLILVGLSVVMILPFYWMVTTSFKVPGDILTIPPQWFPTQTTVNHYIEILFGQNFIRYGINSLVVGLLSALLQLFGASLAGFGFAYFDFRGKELIFGLVIATMLIPLEVTIIPEFIIMTKFGWTDTYLPLILPFLAAPFGTFLMRQFFKNIPEELFDSARIDGCSAFEIYWRIALPLAKPALATLFLITFMNSWIQLMRPAIYLQTRSLYTLPIALASLQGFYESQWGPLMAGSTFSILPLIIVFLFTQKHFTKGISASSGVTR